MKAFTLNFWSLASDQFLESFVERASRIAGIAIFVVAVASLGYLTVIA